MVGPMLYSGRRRRFEDASLLFIRRHSQHRVKDGIDRNAGQNPHLRRHQQKPQEILVELHDENSRNSQHTRKREHQNLLADRERGSRFIFAFDILFQNMTQTENDIRGCRTSYDVCSVPFHCFIFVVFKLPIPKF